MGKHVLRRPDHASHQELTGAEVDVGPDLRVARQERHLLQGEGRQRQFDWLEGKNDFAFPRCVATIISRYGHIFVLKGRFLR